ncbi:heparinase II/III family protein [Massilia sp. NR 4-1]|uniref:heparinase II/III domain-containing protein n=1 Tax=Massilia sp. NR 4-1 TaxID=1678028 RepID=UPI00067CE4FE|nr:heparinase II/III family protein [Massilia sp. NR 4-1]AKU20487.1 hypothetical protein ACZ75_02080 [Massilia sp. NR 4-1]
MKMRSLALCKPIETLAAAPLKLLLPALVAGLFSAPAYADLPAPVRTTHPRLLAHKADIERLGPFYTPSLPEAGGVISFDYTPREPGANEPPYQPLFGWQDLPNALFIRHLKTVPGQYVILQFALNSSSKIYLAGTEIKVPLGKTSRIRAGWNQQEKTIFYQVGEEPAQSLDWKIRDQKWSPASQDYSFSMLNGETIQNYRLQDLQGKVLGGWDVFDSAEQTAWLDLRNSVGGVVRRMDDCSKEPKPADLPDFCKVTTLGRGDITETAKNLVLAYRLSNDDTYLKAAKAYAKLLISVRNTSSDAGGRYIGGEWSMAARVAAMGYLYDWLFDEMNEPIISGGKTYREELAGEIIETIRTIKPPRNGENFKEPDLRISICGEIRNNDPSITPFNCDTSVSFERTPNNYNTIAYSYLGGHNASAIMGTMTGLLAIENEHRDLVKPLLGLLYEHFRRGLFAAREYVSVDGGHHMGYAYAAANAEIGERIALWRKALEEPVSGPVFAADWQSKLIYPYLYAMRHDNSFPASGDNYGFTAPELSTTALHAANVGQDPFAMAFYQKYARGTAKTNFNARRMVWDKLLYPQNIEAANIATLPLARHFRNAGQVLMRDRWENDKATVLEFKSTSFSSENHQHLDQNSFALSYKAPLLLDSGAYDSYGNSHWSNYYTRTIAHNSIVVFEPGETFKRGDKEYSNDGGQWYAGKENYPTLAEIAPPNGKNYLDGVTEFENGDDYAYVSGNASKAYNKIKMDQSTGFIRSLVYLRPAQGESKPTILVFDRIRTEGQVATSLLHFATRPEGAGVTEQADGGGRYKLTFPQAGARSLTAVNGAGKVRVQMLLPESPLVYRVGGQGGTCEQVVDDKVPKDPSDCRYLVRQRQADGFKWVNYAYGDLGKAPAHPQDYGVWRLETSAATASKGVPQYFLSVLQVGDASSEFNAAGIRLAAQDAEAVQLGYRVVLFNRGSEPASRYSWSAGDKDLSVLATGLKKNADYRLTVAPEANLYRYTLEEAAGANLRSSGDGVLRIRHP